MIRTQEECRKEFVGAVREFIGKLKTIDDNTPAVPTQEPKWWLDMMQLMRDAKTVEETFKK